MKKLPDINEIKKKVQQPFLPHLRKFYAKSSLEIAMDG